MANKFFKVILRKNKLILPPKFVARHGKALSESVTLQLPSGSEWEIGLKRRGDENITLREGWGEFAAHYSIEVGHFLVFEYKGGSVFKVDVFDTTACSVDEYPPKRGDRSISKTPEIRCSKADIVRCNKPLSKSEIENCLKVSRDFVSRKPHFRVVMQPSYVVSSRLTIPKSFAREHMQFKECDVTLRSILDGRCWEAKFVDGSYKTNRDTATPKLFGGWGLFSSDNNLDVGDVVVFVLDDDRPVHDDRPSLLFGVLIYRANSPH